MSMTGNVAPGMPARQDWGERGGQWTSVNVGDVERWASVLGGGALVAYGLGRGGFGGLFLAGLGGCLVYRGVSGHCPMYGSFGFNTASRRHSPQAAIPAGGGVKIERSISVNRSPEELYRFWRNLENLPRVMSHLQRVESRGGNRSYWVARAPLGMSAAWDAEIITDHPNEAIGWKSLPDSQVATAGSVHFTRAPGGGTQVRVVLKYDPPGGKLGAWLAWLFGEAPGRQIEADLRRFKQEMEAGEPIFASGQPGYR
jgi:uncharacterized membrane protein